jgi:uncharacterized membrane protein
MLNAWLHLVALFVYLGAVVGLGALLLPSLAILDKHEDRVHLLARALKFYNPLQVGALGILIFSGAFQLTDLKAVYREKFIQQFGYPLSMKLLAAFFLVMFSVYQSMGIGHRFVRGQEAGESVTPEQLNAVIRRLKGGNWLILALALMTLWLGLRLRP